MNTAQKTVGKAFGRRLALGAVAGVAALALAAPTALADDGGHDDDRRIRAAGPLQDLQLATEDPTDGATAQVKVEQEDGETEVSLKIQGLGRGSAGLQFGAHVHVGPCVAGNGAAADAHFNINIATRSTPVVISEETEVWLDFVIGRNGTARAEAEVPFVIPPGGAGSVVIHEKPTAPGTGLAGARIACLPVQF